MGPTQREQMESRHAALESIRFSMASSVRRSARLDSIPAQRQRHARMEIWHQSRAMQIYHARLALSPMQLEQAAEQLEQAATSHAALGFFRLLMAMTVLWHVTLDIGLFQQQPHAQMESWHLVSAG